MTDTQQDIRKWGKNKGYGEDVTGRLPMNETVVELPETDILEERPPKLGPTLKERARAVIKPPEKTDTPPRKALRSPVKSIKARVPVDKVISTGWSILARFLAPVHPPVASVVAMQAPVAGLILEDYIKGTLVDRVLQPLARVEESGQVVMAMLGPPVLVTLWTARPEMAPVIMPLLRQSLGTWIDVAGPKLEQVAKREAQFEEKYGEQIDDMMNALTAAIIAYHEAKENTNNATTNRV